MIAVQLPGSDPALDIAGACVAVGLFGGGIAWLLLAAGRDARDTAAGQWGRRLGYVTVQLGRFGLTAAAVLLTTGLWVGLTTHTPAEKRRAEAAASCKEDARLQHLTGEGRDDFVRQCTWQRSD